MRVDWYRGLRAGAKLGLIIFAVELTLSLLYTEVLLSWYLGYEFHWEGIGATIIYLMGDLIIFLVVCITIGVLFPVVRARLPGDTDKVKALIMFVPIWALYVVVSTLILVSAFGQTFLPYYEIWIVVLVILSIPYGYLMGLLWEREEPTDW
ncbi:MAG: hypothetical protein JSW25_04135 [Thermoplasmata archaeon]|nr:MAG: hypothetical protein JSW25_04135 [Thermoplasmata archaeon]